MWKDFVATYSMLKIQIKNLSDTLAAELEGIVLLTELYKDVSLIIFAKSFMAYADSKVALAWVRNLKDATHKVLKNQVSKICKTLDPSNLHYVESAENPSDQRAMLVIRGRVTINAKSAPTSRGHNICDIGNATREVIHRTVLKLELTNQGSSKMPAMNETKDRKEIR